MIAVVVLGFAGWMWLRRRSQRARAAQVTDDASVAEAAGAWTEACCPACLALAAVRQARSSAVFVPET